MVQEGILIHFFLDKTLLVLCSKLESDQLKGCLKGQDYHQEIPSYSVREKAVL